MSEYSKFSSENNTEFICPACGAVLTEQERVEGGWNCKCGDFIPESMAINQQGAQLRPLKVVAGHR